MTSDPSSGVSATSNVGSTTTTSAEKRAASSGTSALVSSDAKRPRLADGVPVGIAGSVEWNEVISELQPAIVALKVTWARSFEEDPAATSLGTGFVVDKDQGLILTNRHITGVGPVRATAIFDRHEELEVEVLYRDPIHDFGFFKFDPSRLRLTRSAEVKLDPEGLQVGTEIRVVGNDAGEKLQILSGTIARVDRNVPEFCTLYNDENTFYAGAGAGTSGGSSGSPVLNKQGHAIALNAAGQEGTASAFFLPLDRVRYSFDLLRAGKPVPRGTCMAGFLFKPFDELIRVGLLDRHEQEVLSAEPETTGMLIVDSVLCNMKLLRPGDILIRLEGAICVGFAQLEAVLDSHVGQSVKLQICRASAELTFDIPVVDLHALIPRSFVELGMDILHGLGYHAARRAQLPLDSGMYVARAGYVFDSLGCDRAALVTNVGKKPTLSPETFIAALKDVKDRQYFPVSWYELADFRRDRTLRTGFAKMSWAWSPLRLWRYENSAGGTEKWVAVDIATPTMGSQVPVSPPVPCMSFTGGDPLVRRLQSSLVTIRFRTDRRFCTEASHHGTAEGVGLLVDAKRGLVLTDRHSAPQSLGDVEVTLGGSATVDAEVVFIHPLHNIAVIRCDPSALLSLHAAKVPIAAARLAQGARASLRAGEDAHFVGFDNQGNAFSARVTIAATYLPSGKDEFPMWDVPRFRERNLEIVGLADTPEEAKGGVLCDSTGAVRAFFAAFDWQGQEREVTTEPFGIPTSVFAPLVKSLQAQPDAQPKVASLDIEVSALDVASLARGSEGKLPRAWLQAVGQRCGRQGQIPRALRVQRVMPTGASEGQLRPGDVLLNIGGRNITGCLDVEAALELALPQADATKAKSSKRGSAGGYKARGASRGAGSKGARTKSKNGGLNGGASAKEIDIKVFRDGEEVDVAVTPALLGSEDDSRLIIWAGMVLRSSPRCILDRCGESVARVAGGVFVQNVLGGSPADTREIMPHCFLREIGERHVRTLDDVIEAVTAFSREEAVPSSKEGAVFSRPWVRLCFVDLYGQEHVKAVQADSLFFPTLELQRSDENRRWQCVRRSASGPPPGAPAP